MRMIFTAALAVALQGCAAIVNPAQATGSVQAPNVVLTGTAAADRATAMIAAWRADPAKTCESESISAASSEVARLRGLTSGTYITSRDPQSARALQDIYSRRYVQLAAMHAPGQLALADAYLEGDCLDQADRLYRQVIEMYVGGSFEALRQRAQIGVDDVRSKRAPNGQR